jgi:hypothetical protein
MTVDVWVSNVNASGSPTISSVVYQNAAGTSVFQGGSAAPWHIYELATAASGAYSFTIDVNGNVGGPINLCTI